MKFSITEFDLQMPNIHDISKYLCNTFCLIYLYKYIRVQKIFIYYNVKQ